jgi:uncharacterized protein YjbJ (UPF0337 family)
MKGLPWIIAGITIGTVITYVALYESGPEYPTRSDTVEDAAHKAFEWGTKQRVAGKGQSVAGSVKEGIGRVTGDADLTDEGAVEGLGGDVKDAVGELGHAVGETIHDLNV